MNGAELQKLSHLLLTRPEYNSKCRMKGSRSAPHGCPKF